MAIKQITIPYSWYNITAALDNNVLTYYLPNSSNVQTPYSTTLVDGFYDTAELNTIMQTQMRGNGHYWFSAAKGTFSGTITGNVLTVLTTTVLLTVGQLITYIGSTGITYNCTILSSAGATNTYNVTTTTAMTSATEYECINFVGIFNHISVITCNV